MVRFIKGRYFGRYAVTIYRRGGPRVTISLLNVFRGLFGHALCVFTYERAMAPSKLIKVAVRLSGYVVVGDGFGVMLISPGVDIRGINVTARTLVVVMMFFGFICIALLGFFGTRRGFRPLPSLSLPVFFLCSWSLHFRDGWWPSGHVF